MLANGGQIAYSDVQRSVETAARSWSSPILDATADVFVGARWLVLPLTSERRRWSSRG
jgi:hypothetical protein